MRSPESRVEAGLLSLCLVLLVACNPRDEGCLDLEAVNFNLGAEKDCNDCCDYPQLYWNMEYKWDTFNFAFHIPYATTSGDSIRFQHASFLLCDIRFVETSGDTLYVLDRITLECDNDGGEEYEVEDDFTLISRQGFNFPIGMRSESPELQGLNTSIGLREELQCYNPDLLQPGHPLSRNGIYDQELQRAALARFYYSFQGDTIPDTVIVHGSEIPLSFTFSKDLRQAATDTFRLEVDYALLFEGITPDMPVEAIEGQIREKLAGFLRYHE